MEQNTVTHSIADVIYCSGIVALNRTKDNNYVLLVEHTSKSQLPSGTHGLPAGKIMGPPFTETFKEASLREGFQETGIKFDGNCVIPIFVLHGKMPIGGKYVPTEYHGFLSLYQEGKLTSSDNGKTIPKYINVKKLDELLLVSPDIIPVVNHSLHIKYHLDEYFQHLSKYFGS